MRRLVPILTLAMIFMAGNVMGESIQGKLGITGKAGIVVPLKDGTINGAPFWVDDVGFAGGGGVIYGISDRLAAELDVTHTPSLDVKMGAGGKVGELQSTDISLGIQYRFMPERALVPYVGVGVDFIRGDVEDSKLEWAAGGHVSLGADYFLYRRLALNLECRGILADKNDIEKGGITVGSYDPTGITTTVSIRLFLPEKMW